ncbi:hypothetical protein BABINDRAFT_15627 [Babjeviella inositovora NRRL Y-12698]|uniref:ATPase expression protein 2, mitochondrial n=1 Tax=Babjeviella inositovora NRRL Y-12698 TaxID=984486 RepID=A0A1E3QIC3_9ASCO|nr:uncharacterized protein BABINDRAFT_15627 [Babjeviella inositovora NRRL Y-12698]ODQ77390.1 hypothetical protein BABINDRAFT_15627 [Babjeviella inositovora NRRL Y-12698]
MLRSCVRSTSTAVRRCLSTVALRDPLLSFYREGYQAAPLACPAHTSIPLHRSDSLAANEALFSHLHNHDFEALTVDLLQAFQFYADDKAGLRALLTRDEVSRLVGAVAEYQMQCARLAYRAKGLKDVMNDNLVRREQCRRLYRDLLVLKGHFKSVYALSMADQELFLRLDMANMKLHKVSVGLKAMEALAHKRNVPLSLNVWDMKIRALGSAMPELWKFRGKKVEFTLSSGAAFPKVTTQPSTLLAEFYRLGLAPNARIHEAFVYSFGNAGDIARLQTYLNNTWGFRLSEEEGESIFGAPKLLVTDARALSYPSASTLAAVVSAFAKNDEFEMAMQYVNEFQKHYTIDLSTQEALHFWKVLFAWAALTTSFSTKALPLAQQQHILERRFNTMETLWALFEANHNKPDLKLLRVRMLMLKQSRKLDLLLAELPRIHAHVRANQECATRVSLATDAYISINARNMYESFLKSIMKLQFDKNSRDIDGPRQLVLEWALDADMTKTLQEVYDKRRVQAATKRTALEERTIQKNAETYDKEDDSLLQLW